MRKRTTRLLLMFAVFLNAPAPALAKPLTKVSLSRAGCLAANPNGRELVCVRHSTGRHSGPVRSAILLTVFQQADKVALRESELVSKELNVYRSRSDAGKAHKQAVAKAMKDGAATLKAHRMDTGRIVQLKAQGATKDGRTTFHSPDSRTQLVIVLESDGVREATALAELQTPLKYRINLDRPEVRLLAMYWLPASRVFVAQIEGTDQARERKDREIDQYFRAFRATGEDPLPKP